MLLRSKPIAAENAMLPSFSRRHSCAPGLAPAWHVDPNNDRPWIFTLREAVTFQDGKTMTAEDLVSS